MILFAEIPLADQSNSSEKTNKEKLNDTDETGIGFSFNDLLKIAGIIKKPSTNKKTSNKKVTSTDQTPSTQMIPIYLSERKGIKRITLAFSSKTRRMILTAPPRTPRTYLRTFIKTHHDWIQQQVAKPVVQPKVFTPGALVPFEGRNYTLVHQISNRVIVEIRNDTLFIQAAASRIDTHVRRFLIKRAHESLEAKSHTFAQTLGVSIKKITVKAMHTRWGSCSSDGNLNYNWRLILAPPEILIYVCAHEVAHRVYMDHSAAFWQTVAKLYPDYKTARLWLKKNGQSLYAFG